MRLQFSVQIGDLRLAPEEAGRGCPEVARRRVECPQGREVRAHTLGAYLKHIDRLDDIAQSPRSEVDQIDADDEPNRRAVEQHLPAMARGHHPRGRTPHRAEVVVATEFSLAGCDAHPYR